MNCGMKVLDLLLSECFAFEKKLWVYSGRRGVHCWICDEEARNLDNESKAAVTSFLHIYNGSEKSGKKLTISPKYPHPTFAIDSNVYEICEKYFQEIYCEDYSMNIFESPENWNLILGLLSDSDTKLRIELKTYLESAIDNADGAEMWLEIKKKLKQFKREGYIPYIVYSFVYPRLDANVSKQLNHLLKSPFCVHPSTESICVPISNDDFYPEYDCPTVRLLTEGNEESKEKWERAMRHFIKFVKKGASSKYIKPEPNENDKMELEF
jgi:DNA primase small subunit